MSQFAVARLDELERFPAEEGLLWRPIRRRFGISAFGANAYTAEAAGQRVVEEHSEATSGHEELYVVVRGRARFTVGDEELDAPAGTLVFVEPGTRRGAVAEEAETTVLALGGKRGEAFAISPWETVFAAYGHRRLGDTERGWALLREAVESNPSAWQGRYHMACFAALDGDRETALDHLASAVELDPTAARWAAEDEDFAAIRDDPRFPAAPA